MGADEAVLVAAPVSGYPDAYQTADLLSTAISDHGFDLILTGSVSGDSGAGVVGGMLAAMLDIPQVALATSISVVGNSLRVQHEVENGLERVVEVDLPSLVSVQTGINEPRYVSIRGIRKVSGTEIPEFVAQAPPKEPWTSVVSLSLPVSDDRAEILDGSVEDMVDQLVERLKDRGGI
jgi:electron transfer flavoprotein beta subunit